jgi:hypothetical protein
MAIPLAMLGAAVEGAARFAPPRLAHDRLLA